MQYRPIAFPTPAHGTFPSAHSTEAFAVAEVLRAFVAELKHHYADYRNRQELLSKLAERIAVNRTVAGVHYPIDTWAGAVLGRAVGQIILAKCGAGAGVYGYRYQPQDCDFFLQAFMDEQQSAKCGVEKITDCMEVPSSPLFEYLWGKACKEFDLHDGPK